MDENSYTETTEITEAEQELLRQHASTILKDYYEYLRQREERKRLRSQKRLEVHEKQQKSKIQFSLERPDESMAYSASYSPDYYERIKSGKEAHPSSASVASCEIPPLSLEKTFSERMQELMEEKGMTGPNVYKNADVGKDVFSRILSRKDYPLSKETAVSIALALNLSPDDADDLLERAGFSLSRSLLRDRALRYCFEEKIYNIVRVNILLDELNCRLLTRSRY